MNRLADLHLRVREFGKARQGYEEALTIREAVASQHPDNVGYQRDVLVSIGRIANSLMLQEDWRNSLSKFERVLAGFAALSERRPQDLGLLRDVALTAKFIAIIQDNLGEDRAALLGYREAESVLKELEAKDPGTAQFQHDLFEIEFRSAELHAAMGNRASALALYERALERISRLRSADKGNKALLEKEAATQRRIKGLS
ncbi:MAG: tetratricopeptide repeat protein [Pseudomonadota bacterium]